MRVQPDASWGRRAHPACLCSVHEGTTRRRRSRCAGSSGIVSRASRIVSRASEIARGRTRSRCAGASCAWSPPSRRSCPLSLCCCVRFERDAAGLAARSSLRYVARHTCRTCREWEGRGPFACNDRTSAKRSARSGEVRSIGLSDHGE